MLAALSLWLLATLQSAGASFPALTGRVVDEASVLSPSEEASLVERLERLEAESSVQIVVASVRSLDGRPIEDYSIALAREWGVGQSETDNGVLILFVPSERRVRIEVGYGLEPVIPDGMAGRIIREHIAPAFREERYFDGLSAALDGLELAARREYPEPLPPAAPEREFELGSLLLGYLILGIMGNALGPLIAMGLGAFVFVAFGGALAAWLGVLAYPVGAVLGWLAVWMVREAASSGSWTSGGGGGYRGGGGWGGGGFGGFGSGGGGFSGGGFSGGGGSFGGGGASGRW